MINIHTMDQRKKVCNCGKLKINHTPQDIINCVRKSNAEAIARLDKELGK